ncbi:MULTISPECIES: YegJ family protein [Mesorhizobium]|uniref:YegJ family protein n=1 Tax=Mesorhizobium TaxID=68287 RepID=UPI001FE26E5A|nr:MULTISPECIES: DUF2314 domain-containing protein [Mesorhizobium]
MNFRKQYHRLNSDTLSATEIISGRFGSPDEPTSVREKSRLAGLWRAVSITAQPPQFVSSSITKQLPTGHRYTFCFMDRFKTAIPKRIKLAPRLQTGNGCRMVRRYDEGGPSMKLAVRAMISLMLALAPGSAGAQGADPGDDKTIIFTPDDPEMAAATAQALASLDDFLALSEAPPSDTDRFKLKVKVRDGNVTEHFWVIPFRRTETGFVGILANQPEEVHNVVLGQNIEFTRDDISDWGYTRGGRQVGSFTVCVMFNKMSKEEADTMRDQYGFDC